MGRLLDRIAKGHKVGREGTVVTRVKRTVREGGMITYDGDTYQHDRLIPFVGQQVHVQDFFDHIDVSEFHLQARRKCRETMNGLEWYTINRTILGNWICTCKKPYHGPYQEIPEEEAQ